MWQIAASWIDAVLPVLWLCAKQYDLLLKAAVMRRQRPVRCIFNRFVMCLTANPAFKYIHR
ncbi:hypothetical protein [Nitrosomonas sp.]|uniref:hypothetical protein n=1 Tax=Nitrosomonas sp. TaxID=42353 RepID=UPI00262AD795|nr:hypothetical protein [Nitrosomonas sp.]